MSKQLTIPFLEQAEVTSLEDQVEVHLARLSLDERRTAGKVYTPAPLASFILDLAGYPPSEASVPFTLLDPACGAGVFLEQAVTRLAATFLASGERLDTKRGATRFRRRIESSLFGVDIDPEACALAVRSVQRMVACFTGPIPSEYFTRNVAELDFLGDELPENLPAKGFDLVVGNPPYVSATRIPGERKAEYLRRYETANGRLDLYTLFMERGLEVLRPYGVLAFVTPDKYLSSKASKRLRGFLASGGSVETIARFHSHKTFANAATVPCVTVVRKGDRSSFTRVLECSNQDGERGDVAVVREYSAPSSTWNHEPWTLVPEELQALARRIQADHPTLEGWTERISAGPATGRDRIYVFPAGSVDVEEELLHPAVRGRDLHPFTIEDPGLQILVPYELGSEHPPRLIDLGEYPKARSYLEQHREDLSQRHCVRVWRKEWFDLHDQTMIDLAKAPKILVIDVARHNRFAADPGRYFPLHSAYYILPSDPADLDYLTGVLNSPLTEFLVRLFAPVVKDGFSRYRRQFLQRLPVPEASARLREEVEEAARVGDQDRIRIATQQLFGISEGDLQAASEYLASRR